MDSNERQAAIERIVADREAIFRALRAEVSRDWLGVDLSLPQLRVLLVLEQEGGLTMSALAEALNRAQPTVTGLVDRLVEEGLLRRVEHPGDRRSILVELTPAGGALIDRLTLASSDHTRRLLTRLSRDELGIVARAFALLRREAMARVAERRIPIDHPCGRAVETP